MKANDQAVQALQALNPKLTAAQALAVADAIRRNRFELDGPHSKRAMRELANLMGMSLKDAVTALLVALMVALVISKVRGRW